MNLARGYPLLSLATTALISAGLHRLWRRAGRPTGVEDIELRAEAED